MKEKEYFWNDFTDLKVHEWIKTQHEDLWFTYVRPALTGYACWSIRRYGRDRRLFLSYTDLLTDLVTQAAIALLTTYKQGNGSNLRTFVFTVMHQYIITVYRDASAFKRDYRQKVFLSDIDPMELEAWAVSYQPESQLVRDPNFILFFCGWWKRNVSRYFKGKSAKAVYLILDILMHPEHHRIGRDKIYTRYICQRCNITRQRLNQITQKMKSKSHFIQSDYETGGLLNLVF